MKRLLLLLLFAGSLSAATLVSDGSRADVQAKIDLAVNGDTVTIPAGSFTWTSTVTITGKAVHLQGAGAGRVVARIAAAEVGLQDAVTLGMGTQVFTLRTENVASLAALRSEITPGRTLKIHRLGPELVNIHLVVINNEPWMQGTVISLVGNVLTMNITSSNGSGTHPMWTVSTLATTTIVNDKPSAEGDRLIDITESTAGSVELSGIRLAHSTGTGSYWQHRNFIRVLGVTNGLPVLIHDLYFDMASYCVNLILNTNRGVVWNCSFNAQLFATAALAIEVNLYAGADAAASWGTASTMGTADATGRSNVYVEDCDFHAFLNSTDIASGSRMVFRYCLFNNGGIGSHGNDTGDVGLRHFEIYNCEIVYNGYNSVGYSHSVGMSRMIWIRGGTGVITDSIIPLATGWDYSGNMKSIHLSILNLNRDSGADPWWGKNIPGVQYHCPRQLGFGRVTGTGLDGLGRSTSNGSYVGDLEPLYIWNNTGGYNLQVYSETQGAGEDNISDYLHAGTEYFNNGTAKPGWAKFEHPHPLRTGATQAAADPSFNPVAGTYESAQSVTITSATSGATIRYTVDGSTPTSSSGTVYSLPVLLLSTTTLKAIAYKSGLTDSSVTSGTYTIDEGGAPPTATITVTGTARVDGTLTLP